MRIFSIRTFSISLLLILPALVLGSCRQHDDRDLIFITEKSGPWLGVQVTSLSEKILQNMDLDHGVKIVRVIDESPAEEAGLEKDDVIITFDGREVRSPDDLQDFVHDTESDKEVQLTYVRGGEEKIAVVKISKRPARSKFSVSRHPDGFAFKAAQGAWLGVETTGLNDQLRVYFGGPEDLGVLIKRVIEDSPAEKGGLQAGDVIIGVADRKIKSTRDLIRSIRYYDPDEEVEIRIIRDKKEKSLTIKLGESENSFDFRFYGDIPENDIELHEFDFEPEVNIEINKEKLRELEEKIEKNIRVKTIELNKKLDVLEKELEKKLETITIRQI